MTGGTDHARTDVARDDQRSQPGATGGGTAGLIAVCLGFFVIQLDVTIVNVALPAIARGVGGSLGGLQWVIDAYTLALASVMLTAGSEADRTLAHCSPARPAAACACRWPSPPSAT